MNADFRFLLRKSTGDQPLAAEAEIRDCLQMGQCKPSDFLFDFEKAAWFRVGDHPALASLFATKPATAMERKIVYYLLPGVSSPQGPFSTKEIQQKAQAGELCDSTWVFVDGDKEWRQVRAVKVLHDMLPALPVEKPAGLAPPAAAPAPAPAPAPATGELSLGGLSPAAPVPTEGEASPIEFSIGLGLEEAPPSPPSSASSLSFNPSLSADALPASPPPAAPEKPPVFAPSVAPAFADIGDQGGLSNPSIPSIILEVNADEEATPMPMAKPSVVPAPAPAANGPSPFAQALLESNGFEPTGEVKVTSDEPEREEATMALDTLGLSLSSTLAETPPAAPASVAAPLPSAPAGPPPMAKPAKPPGIPPVPPARPSGPQYSAAPAPAPAASAASREGESFDGIVAEIPSDPIWLVKPAGTENISGPFRFLDVVKFLSEGKLTKYDKISRVGTKSFVKILQQYEFNVKYSIETVVERGVERQKILIKRRHPRVPYITGVQVLSRQGMLAGNCINISAGGVLMEVPKAEFNLGEILELKILPGLIPKSISCKALVIGKIPKIPPGYALKFEDLKNEDKEAIEFYVQETLKRELPKKN